MLAHTVHENLVDFSSASKCDHSKAAGQEPHSVHSAKHHLPKDHRLPIRQAAECAVWQNMSDLAHPRDLPPSLYAPMILLSIKDTTPLDLISNYDQSIDRMEVELLSEPKTPEIHQFFQFSNPVILKGLT